MSVYRKLNESYKLKKARASVADATYRILGLFKRLGLRRELAMRHRIQIHFGCGDINDRRFINVDARPLPHVHLITKSPLLRPFGKNSVDMIYACHAFEHFPFAQQRRILQRWLEVLKPGGRLILSVPDFDLLVAAYLAHGREVREIQGKLMGAQDYRGNFHFAIFTREHLGRLLSEIGFTNINPWDPRNEEAWPRDFSWDASVSLNLAAEKLTS